MPEHEADQEEIDGNGDAEDAQGGCLVADTQAEEDVEEHHVEQIVDQMGTTEPNAVLGRHGLAEREVGGEIIVEQQTEQIAYRVGHIDIDPMLQHPIDGIMGKGGHGAHHAETDNLAESLTVEFHGGKVTFFLNKK